VILVAAFGGYIAHALLRRPWTDRGAMPEGAVWRGLIGLPAIGVGAVVAVIGAQRLGSGLGVPDLITGLFAIGLLCALPESYSAWRFTREGKPTMAIGAVIGDGIVSLTVAVLPPAIVGAAVGNVPIYLLNLGFLAAVLVAYVVLNHRRRGQKIGLFLVSLYVGGYLAYLAATVFLLSRTTWGFMVGWAVVAVPILGLFLVGVVARGRDLPSVIRRFLLWLALVASVLSLLRVVMREKAGHRARCSFEPGIGLCRDLLVQQRGSIKVVRWPAPVEVDHRSCEIGGAVWRVGMARKQHKPEEIVAKLRQVEVLVGQGKTLAEGARAIGVTEATYYR
jgi:hypothetical protein